YVLLVLIENVGIPVRGNQKLSALRSKILGLNKLNPLLCTICKTGIAKIEEENDMNWIINNNSNKEYLQDELLRIISSLLNNEINDNHMPMNSVKPIHSFIHPSALPSIKKNNNKNNNLI
ncbi:hypothetical protein PFDG_02790, partial [Plasmodium falciparum Dd2]